MNYYLVSTKCGHVGRDFYIPIIFPVIAESGKEAAAIARSFPRVKHNHKDAILGVMRVEQFDFERQQEINNNDPYLKFHSRQEQDVYMDELINRVCPDNHQNEIHQPKLRGNKPNLKYQNQRYQNFDYYQFEEEELFEEDCFEDDSLN